MPPATSCADTTSLLRAAFGLQAKPSARIALASRQSSHANAAAEYFHKDSIRSKEQDLPSRQILAAAAHPTLRWVPQMARSRICNAAPRQLRARKSPRESDTQFLLETTILSAAGFLQTPPPGSKLSPAAHSLQSPFALRRSPQAASPNAPHPGTPAQTTRRSTASLAYPCSANTLLESRTPASRPAPRVLTRTAPPSTCKSVLQSPPRSALRQATRWALARHSCNCQTTVARGSCTPAPKTALGKTATLQTIPSRKTEAPPSPAR